MLAEATEKEEIIYADIGMLSAVPNSYPWM